MGDFDEGLIMFFSHVSAKRLSEAKMMVDSFSSWGTGRLRQGRRSALEGIINLSNPRSHPMAGFDQMIEQIGGVFAERMSTIWCDEFDRGYFEVWLQFLNFARKQNLVKNI